MCSFATKFVVESWSTIADADITPAPNPTIAAADKEPLTSAAICAEPDNIPAPSPTIAVVKLLLELEPDMIPAPNPTTAAVENEPLISSANCAELDIRVFPNSDSAVVILVEKLALGATKDPLTSVAICAELDITLSPVVLKTVASTAKLLFAAIVPPPDNPSPAVNVIDVWSTCSFATKFANESWSIVPCVAVPTKPVRFVA